MEARRSLKPGKQKAPVAVAEEVSGRSRLELWLIVGLVSATLLAYAPVLDCSFVDLDDIPYVVGNTHVAEGLTGPNIRWAFTTFECANWHPLTWLSLLLDRNLYGGLEPGGFHFTNLLLHVLNAALLFHVLSVMTGAAWRSAFVAALFALHPVHVESVAWIAERKDVLSSLFWMLTLWAYVAYVRKPGPVRYLLVFLAFTLGLMAKPMLVTLPFVLLLLDYWPVERLQPTDPETYLHATPRPWPQLVFEKLPLLVLAIASSVVTLQAQGEGEAIISLGQFPFYQRLLSAFRAYGCYLAMLVWPHNLAIWYPQPREPVLVAQGIVCGVLLVLITAAVLFARKRRYFSVGWFWYLGTLVPVIGLVQVGIQAMADRYTYIPSIGIFVASTWGVAELVLNKASPARRILLGGAASVILLTCAGLTLMQLAFWRDRERLWLHAVDATTQNFVAHEMLGRMYRDADERDKALDHFARAVAANPTSPDCRYNLGLAYLKMGDTVRAREQLAAALQLRPTWSDLHRLIAFTHVVAGDGDLAAAASHIRSAGESVDGRSKALPLSAFIEHELGHLDLSAQQYKEALKEDPAWPEGAIEQARELLKSKNPSRWDLQNALYLARQACLSTQEEREEFLETLASIQMALGRGSDAALTLRKAIALNQDPSRTERKRYLEQRLKDYESRR